jgi:Zn-dependent protease with chaperone function
MPPFGAEPLAAWLWQVALHSLVASAVLLGWARRLRLGPGRAKRWLLATALVLPLVTASVPGRTSPAFRDRLAWFDSARVLALPLGGPARVHHLVLGLAALTAAAALAQEVAALARRTRADDRPAPRWLVDRVRALPGCEGCRVGLLAADPLPSPPLGADPAAAGDILFVSLGRPSRPRLLVSEGALSRLAPDEIDAALAHERAHWRPARWWGAHLLFLARLAQLPNPVALWLFREYMVEMEIDCDREATSAADPRPLARALLAVYRATDRRDVAARSVLRRRVDLLTGRAAAAPADPEPAAVLAAGAALALVLPWIV